MATSATQHNFRSQDTPNANPAWAELNDEYINYEQRNYWHLASERIAELHLPRLRGDAVRAVELVLTASPEGFRRDADGRALDVRGTAWVQDNLDFLRQRFGEKNVVSFTLHQDEVTPHIHAVVVPVTPDGRLSSRDVFSPMSLRQLQTDYAKAMEPHGFARGIKYSTAIHEDVRRHYGAQQMSREALAELTQPLASPTHRLAAKHEKMTDEQYRQQAQSGFAFVLTVLRDKANKKIEGLATVATANALAHERARVLEKQLAHSQELLVKTREELKNQTTHLTQQLQQTQQELSDQKARTGRQSLNHLRAVMKHLQGEPLSEKLAEWGQEQRQVEQGRIERALAKQLLQPLQQIADIAPAFSLSPYTLTVISSEKFTLNHEKNGMHFKSDELRPNGQDFLKQFQEVSQRTRANQQATQWPSKGEEIEM